MKKWLIAVIVFFAVSLTLGFVNSVKAAEKNTKEKSANTICILFDDGVTDSLEARKAKSQTQLSDWMSADLVRVFARYAKSGYQAKVIGDRKDFSPSSDNYLLTVKIIDYNAGSKAARIIVGFGAGGVSLKINYELLGEGNNTLITKDDSVFSGREWISAARKLNENMAKAVTEKLGKN